MLRDARMRGWLAALMMVALGASCSSPDPAATMPDGFSEPEVFDIIRAGNARAVLDSLTARYEDELQHVRILREDIAELLAAEEGLARRLKSEQESFQDLQAQVGQARARNDQEQARLTELNQSSQASTQARTESEAALGALKAEIQKLQEQSAALEAERQKTEADLARAREIANQSQRPDPEIIARLRAILAELDQGAPPKD